MNRVATRLPFDLVRKRVQDCTGTTTVNKTVVSSYAGILDDNEGDKKNKGTMTGSETCIGSRSTVAVRFMIAKTKRNRVGPEIVLEEKRSRNGYEKSEGYPN